MSEIKKALNGKRYRNIGKEGTIKAYENKLEKVKKNYLVKNPNINFNEVENIISNKLNEQQDTSDQECKSKSFNLELKIREISSEIKVAEYRQNSKMLLKKNYNIAQEYSLKQRLEILKLKQKIEIAKKL